MEIVENLSENDFTQLVTNLNRIMQIAETQIRKTTMSLEMFQVYKIARDTRDLLGQDITSREVIRKLSADPINIIDTPSGMITVPYELMQYIKSGVNRIEAIKESRTVLNLDLKEAKDLVDKILYG